VGYQQVAPTDDLTRYYWGSLETRFKGYVTLPQKTLATLTMPAAALPDAISFATPASGANAGKRHVYFHASPYVGTASTFVYARSGSTHTAASFAVTGVTNPNLLRVVGHNAVVVATYASGGTNTPAGLAYSSDGETFTVAVSTVSPRGLVRFDNKVWTFNATDRMLYAAVDPTQGLYVAPSTNPNGWRALSDVLQLLPGEMVSDLVLWRDNQGQQTLYVLTGQRLIGYDTESGEFLEYDAFGQWMGDQSLPLGAHAVVWPRDRQLYLWTRNAQGEAQRWVRQYTGTVSEVGPTHTGQLGTDKVPLIRALVANAHHVFAFYGDDNILGGPAISQGVLAYNEQGGWHPVYTSPRPYPDRLRAGGYDGGYLYILYNEGTQATCDVVDLPDSATPTIILNSKGQATSGSITLAETECGAPGVYKLGAYLYVDARKPDNTYGLPANNTLRLGTYLYDGAMHSSAIDLTAASTFPAIIPLPDNDATLQTGLPFRRFKLQPLLQKSATTDDSARIMDIGLYYDLWREQRYAYQFAIDFTDAAWGYPTSGTDGVTREQAIANLLTLQNTKQRFKVTFGAANGQQIVIPAAEILVASRTDMNQHGVWPVTIRDVSAPASG
jgi:hypothetical protein